MRGWDEAITDDVCQRIEAALTEAAQQAECQVTPERIWQVSRVPFDQRLRGMVREAATSLGLPCLDMSGTPLREPRTGLPGVGMLILPPL